MSHEINIVLGILYFTQKFHFTLCLHEISGSEICCSKISKIVGENSIS